MALYGGGGAFEHRVNGGGPTAPDADAGKWRDVGFAKDPAEPVVFLVDRYAGSIEGNLPLPTNESKACCVPPYVHVYALSASLWCNQKAGNRRPLNVTTPEQRLQ